MSVSEYKEYFDKNNFQGDKYQTALFIKFLQDKNVKNNQIYDLTKVKKSQITNYKKIIKFNKIEDLKTETLRGIIRDIDNEKKGLKEEPETKQKEERQPETEPENKEDLDLITSIQDMDINDELSTPEEAENAHYAEVKYSPSQTSFKQPFGYSPFAPKGSKLVHRDHEAHYTFLSMNELIKYLDEIKFYEARIRKLEKMSGISDLEELYDENKELKESVTACLP